MKVHVLTAVLYLCCAGEARADLIQLITNGSFASNLNGWSQTPAISPAGDWTRATTQPPANMPVSPANGLALLITTALPGTVQLTQQISSFTDDPSLTTAGTLQWDQYLTLALGEWSTVEQFRVLLSDNDMTFVAFTTNAGDSVTLGPSPQSVNVLPFLQQLAMGESFSVILEAISTIPMHIEVDNFSLLADAPAATPEPGSLLLCTLAGGGWIVVRRRRAKLHPAA